MKRLSAKPPSKEGDRVTFINQAIYETEGENPISVEFRGDRNTRTVEGEPRSTRLRLTQLSHQLGERELGEITDVGEVFIENRDLTQTKIVDDKETQVPGNSIGIMFKDQDAPKIIVPPGCDTKIFPASSEDLPQLFGIGGNVRCRVVIFPK